VSAATLTAPPCRFCGAPLADVFVDLGASPLANSYLEPEDLQRPETFFPLCVYTCAECLLVQLPEAERPDAIFSDYAYFSSFSDSWLEHAKGYAERMIGELALGGESRVVEVASNDGYLLRWFRDRGVPVLGIEPAANVARAAEAAGIPSRVQFFGSDTARQLVEEGIQADLLVGNNVLAHVPNLNDFVAGLAIALAPDGVLTMEFPHLLRLMEEDQFDTIYHEHYSYFSLAAVRRVFARHGLTIFDVEELPTHGGSLRVFACQAAGHAARRPEDGMRAERDSVAALLSREAAAGLDRIEGYRALPSGSRRSSVGCSAS